MWMYAEAAHPTRDDRSLFYIGDLNRTLNQPYFIACLKEMAIHLSLEPEKSALPWMSAEANHPTRVRSLFYT